MGYGFQLAVYLSVHCPLHPAVRPSGAGAEDRRPPSRNMVSDHQASISVVFGEKLVPESVGFCAKSKCPQCFFLQLCLFARNQSCGGASERGETWNEVVGWREREREREREGERERERERER
jgi:hypothetical protein